MKAVFAHDHVFDRQSGDTYASEKLPYTLWRQRYLPIFETIDVVARSKRAEAATAGKKRPAVGAGVNIWPVPSISSPLARLRHSARVRSVLWDRIDRADCVIARLPSEIGLAAVTVARQQGKPTAIEMVGCAWDALWNYGTWQGRAYAPFAYRRNRAAVANASHVIYVSEHFLQERYPTSGFSAGVSDVMISEPEPETLARRLAKECSREEHVTIGLIGSLLPYKGIGTLLRAAAFLKRRRVPSFRLRFLGGGAHAPWRALAAKLGIGPLCDFCGVLPPGPDVWKWLDDIDIYVQPSYVEGLPRATVEAMSQACPVIASTAGGLPELVQPGSLHKPRDSRRLAKLVERMMLDTNWRKECCRFSHSKAREYSPEILEMRRAVFWDDFTQHVQRQAGLQKVERKTAA